MCVLTNVLDDLDVVVRHVECVKSGEWFQVLKCVNEVLMNEKAAQVCLILQVLDLLDPVALEPETAQSCVFLKTLDY